MKFQSIKTSKLKIDEIEQILNLKNSHWNYGYESQLKWFKKNSQPNDFHNLMKINKKIVGYTCLSIRKFEIIDTSVKKNIYKYMLFSTLILNKKFRNFKNSAQMMKFNSQIILKNNYPSFLLTHKDKLNFYKFFGWLQLDKTLYGVMDHENRLKGMVFNFNKFLKNKNYVYNFFYYL